MRQEWGRMIYLLDADSLIRPSNTFYRLNRVPQFWDWLVYQGTLSNVTLPLEQYEEIVTGNGNLVEWLKEQESKDALLLEEEADPTLIAEVVLEGYGDLDETEIEKLGRDPFLISYGLAAKSDRCVVTFENSAPSRKRANRKIPDVCEDLGVNCCTLFDVIEALDFSTDWQPN
jgi:hypothetical protein